ncbi:hypothetical protein D8L93_00735 [Sodalis-like symbiont of Bactericera trigonica]|nr:hypothetical protein D8L93_00735 [Sodalis-like symbiont of Bactericera trigonica]
MLITPHVDIKDKLIKIPKLQWVATYDKTKEIKEIDKNQTAIDLDLQYPAQSKRVSSEVMILCENIEIPSLALGINKMLKNGLGYREWRHYRH